MFPNVHIWKRNWKTYPDNTSIELETLALDVHNITVLKGLGGSHKSSLVHVGVELLGLTLNLLTGVEALKTVLLKCVHENVLGHLQTLNKLQEGLVLRSLSSIELFRGHGQQRAVKVINTLEKVFSKALDSELASTIHIALSAFLKVAEIGDRAKVLVLQECELVIKMDDRHVESKARFTFNSRTSFFRSEFSLVTGSSSVASAFSPS